MFYYTILQTFIWAFLHAFFLFWGVYFPFSYRQLQRSGQVRYAHIASILLALGVPLFSALLPLKDGYISTRNPSLACVGRNSAYTYFLLVLPLSIICCIIACLMILTFWRISNVRTYSHTLAMACRILILSSYPSKYQSDWARATCVVISVLTNVHL